MDSWSGKRSRSQFFPEQDLVVAAFWSTDDSPSKLIELHGFSFSRGTPHPRFVNATITATSTWQLFINVTLVGNHTILNVSSETSQRLFLHSWKDGRVTQLRDGPKQSWSARCAVLSYDTIALVEHYTPTLEICRIVEEPEIDMPPSLRTLARLGLPPLTSGTHILHSYCFPEQMPVYSEAPSFVVEDRPSKRHPFHNSPEERIVNFSVEFEDPRGGLPSRFFTFVTHVRTLIAHATTTLPEVKLIPWKDWGPSGAACFEPFIYDDGCMGERLATISDGSLSLLDFNFTRVQNAMRQASHPSQNAVHSVVKDRVVIPRRRTFETDVVSELPYISVSIPAPSNWGCLHNYEEGLAVFWKDDQGAHVNIYTTR